MNRVYMTKNGNLIAVIFRKSRIIIIEEPESRTLKLCITIKPN